MCTYSLVPITLTAIDSSTYYCVWWVLLLP